MRTASNASEIFGGADWAVTPSQGATRLTSTPLLILDYLQ